MNRILSQKFGPSALKVFSMIFLEHIQKTTFLNLKRGADLDRSLLVFIWGTENSTQVSQAAACDGVLYQMMPEGNETLPAPGVLPI